MTLQEKFTQQHVATIQLSESAQIGEFGSSEETRVPPGTYNVYKVTKKDEGYYGLMYAQEGDFYTNIETKHHLNIRLDINIMTKKSKGLLGRTQISTVSLKKIYR